MYLVVDGIVDLLSGSSPVLAPERIGARRPAGVGELPAIACGVVVSDVAGRGIGRFIGSRHVPLKVTTRLDVGAGADTFSDDLRTLRLPPGIRRDPASVGNGVTRSDVGVVNVTSAAQPVTYDLAARPASATEYRADLSAARVIFGAPQRAGDAIELTYWTTEWHEPTESDRLRGTLQFELWSADGTALAELARRVQDRLALRATARELGFLRLEPSRLDAAAATAHESASGSSYSAWTQRIEYTFTFEAIEGGAVSDGGIIRRIDATIDDGLAESFSIPVT